MHIYAIDEYPPRGSHAIVKNYIKMAGGAGANVIYGLASFGVKCRFYSTVGRDEDAKFFANSMKGVELKLNVTHDLTGRVDVYVDKHGERTFFVHPNASGIVELNISDKDYEDVDYFYLDPFPSEKSFDVHVEIAKNAKKHNKFIILNPKYPYTLLGFKIVSKL